jgi:glutathione S-transferase
MRLYIGNKCFSSWSLRPWIALKVMDIPFEEVLIRLRTPATKDEVARASPSGRIPVLHHEGRVIWESLAILEYLAELHPQKRLWPSDPGGRAWARSIATEMHSGFAQVRHQWSMNLRRPRSHKPLTGEGVAEGRRIEEIWRGCLAAHRRDGPFLFGQFTAADAMYAPVVTRFHTYGGDLAPDIRAYVDAMLALPAMRQWYEEASREPWPEPGPDE